MKTNIGFWVVSIHRFDAQKAVGKYSSDSADVSNLIQKAAEKPATVIYYTSTQQEADKQAQTLAKPDKADYVFNQY